MKTAKVISLAIALALAFTPALQHAMWTTLPGYDRFRVGARWVSVLPALAVPAAPDPPSALSAHAKRTRWTCPPLGLSTNTGEGE